MFAISMAIYNGPLVQEITAPFTRWHGTVVLDWVADCIFLTLLGQSNRPGNEIAKQWLVGTCD